MSDLGNLRIDYDQKIGTGGYGEVYIGWFDNKKVAVKRCDLQKLRKDHLDPRNEHNVLKQFSSLQHPHIIEYYGCRNDKKYFYYVMEFCEHGSLYDHVRKNGTSRPYEPKQVWKIVTSILSVFKAIHAEGYIYRDLSPKNIMVSGRDDDGLPIIKVIDFGLTKSQSAVKGTVVGTRGFFQANIMRNQRYTNAVDYYSLGCLTYYLLCGRMFSDSTTGSEPTPDQIVTHVYGDVEAADFIWFLTHDYQTIQNSDEILRKRFISNFSIPPTQKGNHTASYIRNSVNSIKSVRHALSIKWYDRNCSHISANRHARTAAGDTSAFLMPPPPQLTRPDCPPSTSSREWRPPPSRATESRRSSSRDPIPQSIAKASAPLRDIVNVDLARGQPTVKKSAKPMMSLPTHPSQRAPNPSQMTLGSTLKSSMLEWPLKIGQLTVQQDVKNIGRMQFNYRKQLVVCERCDAFKNCYLVIKVVNVGTLDQEVQFYKPRYETKISLDKYKHGIPDSELRPGETFRSLAELAPNPMASSTYKLICQAKAKIDQVRGYYKFVVSDAPREVKVMSDGRICLRSANGKYSIEYRPGTPYTSIPDLSQEDIAIFERVRKAIELLEQPMQ